MGYWEEHLQDRFGDRDDLGREEAYRTFWGEFPQDRVYAFFALIEQEFGLEPGRLRPDDPVERLAAPIRTRNPLRWFAVEPRLEDSAAELAFQLKAAAEQHGLSMTGSNFETMRECIEVWCGAIPPRLRKE